MLTHYMFRIVEYQKKSYNQRLAYNPLTLLISS